MLEYSGREREKKMEFTVYFAFAFFSFLFRCLRDNRMIVFGFWIICWRDFLSSQFILAFVLQSDQFIHFHFCSLFLTWERWKQWQNQDQNWKNHDLTNEIPTTSAKTNVAMGLALSCFGLKLFYYDHLIN